MGESNGLQCFFIYIYFFFGCAGSVLPHRLFSGCGEQGGHSLVVMCGLLIAMASLVIEHRL